MYCTLMKWWDGVYLYLLQPENDAADKDYSIEKATTEQKQGGLCIRENPHIGRKVDVIRYYDLQELHY